MSSLRIAFLASELYTAGIRGGGTASYMENMSRMLMAAGHEVEIFAQANNCLSQVNTSNNQIKIHWVVAVKSKSANRLNRWAEKGYFFYLPQTLHVLRLAQSMAQSFHRRDKENPFDVVLSTNLSVTGLLLRKRKGLKHILRVTAANDLYAQEDGLWDSRDVRFLFFLERMAMRRADAIFSPCYLTAGHFKKKYKLDMTVIRSPMNLVLEETAPLNCGIPEKYVMHFGQICVRKGSSDLAQALKMAWQKQPDLTMVWVGAEMEPGLIDRFRARWGEAGKRVYYLGALPRPALYRILRNAVAVALPSRVDNFPNSVLESLHFKVPVVGTRGSSVDELVEDEVNGFLVDIDDREGLASALVRCWKEDFPWAPQPVDTSRVEAMLDTEKILKDFLNVCAP